MKNIKTYEEYNVVTFKEHLSGLNHSIFEIIKTKILSVKYLGLIDLDGIENFINLEQLYCYENKIESLKPLEKLINLTYLDCENNKITSLKGVENLTKLKTLHCRENLINWIDYIDKDGRTYYTKLPKSIINLWADIFTNVEDYWEYMDKWQPVGISRKFNF